MSFFASPAVRAEARRSGIELGAVASSAGRETLSREDLTRHGSTTASAPNGRQTDLRFWDVDHSKWGPVTSEPVPRMTQVAAANLSASQSVIPQVTNHGRADMRRVEAFRATLQEEAAARGVKLTALAFHVKALARCLVDFPRFNASLNPAGDTLTLKHYVHVGVAVDTPHGLVVPVIRDADRKGVIRIATEIGEFAARAQDRKLRPEDLGGASMSISNLGGIRAGEFTPLVNPPEVAIMGLSRVETVPIWENGGWSPVPMASLSLSWDHRVVTGADAARFLTRYEALFADPRRLVI
jgi:pyruvate/2-oxoglutarate dehydrogenase complex dihydrolipoamide acyltransferase (E2) component